MISFLDMSVEIEYFPIRICLESTTHKVSVVASIDFAASGYNTRLIDACNIKSLFPQCL